MKNLYYPNVKENLYKIDEYGNIWSNYKKDFLLLRVDKDGYLRVNLSGGSREKIVYCRIANLVAWNFIGPPPSTIKDPTINHIDGNVLNNYFKNLEWCERSVNSSIRQNRGAGSKNSQAKLNEEKVKEICELLINTDLSFSEICNQYQVSKSTVSSILNKKTWKSVTTNYDFSCRKRIRNNLGQFQFINVKFHPSLEGLN